MAGYSRSFNKADGEFIDAGPFTDEFEAISAAMDKDTGHRHDGLTAGEGAWIAQIASQGGKNRVDAIGAGLNKVVFSVNAGGIQTAQVEILDGVILPVTDADIDLGSAARSFKDLHVAGTANAAVLSLANGTSASAIFDQDDMLSDSDVALATQQSIKAYVDNAVTGGHVHDGASGSIVNFIASNDALNAVEIDDTNNRIILSADVVGTKTNKLVVDASSVSPFTDLDISLGGPSNRFINAWAQNLRAGNVQFDVGVLADSILDEADLLSNSATALVTQQSVKAYIDTKIAADILSHNHNGGTSPTLSVIQSPDGLNRVSLNDASNRVVFQVDVAGVATSKAAVNELALYPAIDADIDLGRVTNRFVNVYAQSLLPDNIQFPTGVLADRILDEDDFISNSDTALATQQSIKAYADTSVRQTVPATNIGAAGDLAGMIAADSTYVYLCTTDFDGITPIWTRAALLTW